MAQKRRRRKNGKKWMFWGVMLILFVVAGVMCYLVWDAYFRVKDEGETGDSEGASVEVVEKPEEKKEEELKEEEEPEVVEKEKVVQYEGEDPNESNELTGVVTSAMLEGNYLVVRVNIDQYLSEGNCILELMQNGRVIYSDMVGIEAMVTTATCERMAVPASELNGGEYEVVVRLESGGKRGVIRGNASLE